MSLFANVSANLACKIVLYNTPDDVLVPETEEAQPNSKGLFGTETVSLLS